MFPTIICELGNTSCRLTTFTAGFVTEQVYPLRSDPGAVIGQQEALPAQVVFFSVAAPRATASWLAAVRSRWPQVTVGLTKPGIVWPFTFASAQLRASCGLDRLLALCGFWESLRGGILITAGTAVTVNLITEDGVFRGGVILPGAASLLGALHRDTAALPQLAVSDLAAGSQPLPQVDTEAAMLAGVLATQIGAIKQLLSCWQQHFGSGGDKVLPVAITGGGAQLFTAEFPKMREKTHLAAHGAVFAAAAIRNND